MTLEMIHHFVEVLDKYFGNVCELDLIFNFHKAYFLLDEVFLNGEVQETSKKTILKYAHMQEALLEELQGSNSSAAALLETA
jgi:AP-1 complex subunit sigma 1/2